MRIGKTGEDRGGAADGSWAFAFAREAALAFLDPGVRQIAVLYPALALMGSADPRLISSVGFSPFRSMQAWRIAV